MLYILQYYQVSMTFAGQFKPLQPIEYLDDLPTQEHGDTVTIDLVPYRIVGMPRMRRIDHPDKPGAGAMLNERAVVMEDEWLKFAQMPGLYIRA